MRYYIIAGEASGDLHGSNLIKGIFKKDPDAHIRCIGGAAMAQAGAQVVKDYRENAIMGFVEVLSKLGSIFSHLRFCKDDILKFNPDAIILIDYPGFNLKIAKFAKAAGFKTFYYIPPKVWARGESRVKLLRKYIDHTYIIFPFEVDYFKDKNVDASYFGNPLTDTIFNSPAYNIPKEEFFHTNHLDINKKTIALLAGSRKMEVEYLLPKMIKMAELLDARHPGEYQYILPAAPSIDIPMLARMVGNTTIRILTQSTYPALRYSDAAVISSGTASLEAAIIGTPQVVGYGVNPISYAIAKVVVKIDTISLANLILERKIFRELIQHDCTPENLMIEIEKLTQNSEYRDTMLSDYRELHHILHCDDAAAKIAEDIIKRIQ